jgi:DNA-3-methyladenine glycosylase II
LSNDNRPAVVGKAADTIEARVRDLLPKHTITPEHILSVDDQSYRDAGMSWAKISYMKDLADKVQKEVVVLEELPKLDDERVIETLVQVKGIGRWTAEMFLMFSLGREDIFSHGDLGLRRGLEKLYGLDDPSRDDVEAIVTKWSPYKSYGSVALWHSLE